MRRLLPFIMLVPLAAAAPSAAAQAPPKLAATLESCTASPLPIERTATFVASMPARAGATRMRIRLDLERRRPGERRWRRIQVPGFGTWERSAPNVAGFVFRKRVTGLPVPASYRARVRFRWIAADGSVTRRAHARTAACAQPDLRPNLVAGALTAVLDAAPGLAIYTLTVRNAGRSAAGASSVRVGSGTAEIGPLGPGARIDVPVIALACAPGTPIVVRVDADGRVDESDERRNARRRPCPLTFG